MDLKGILKNPPKVHLGGIHTWSIQDEVLCFLDARLKEGQVTVETGAGLSTVLFALKGTYHNCITPSSEEIARIKEYCRQHEIATDKIIFHVGFSEDIVPTLNVPELDVVLIDGGHGFPTPAIDWFYLSRKLKSRGILVIDDVDIWTGGTLRDFLIAEPNWKLEENFLGRTVVFQKLAQTVQREWNNQPYVVGRSRISRAIRKFRQGTSLLVQGRILEFAEKVRKELKLSRRID